MIRGRSKIEKTGATIGAVLALASGGAAVKSYENIHAYKQACALRELGETACKAVLPPQIKAKDSLGTELGFGAALGIGAGIMAIAISMGSSEQKETLALPLAEVPAGAGPEPAVTVLEIPGLAAETAA